MVVEWLDLASFPGLPVPNKFCMGKPGNEARLNPRPATYSRAAGSSVVLPGATHTLAV